MNFLIILSLVLTLGHCHENTTNSSISDVDVAELLKIYNDQFEDFDRNEDSKTLRFRKQFPEAHHPNDQASYLTMLSQGDEETFESARVGNAHLWVLRRLKQTYGLIYLPFLSSKLPYCHIKNITCRSSISFRRVDGRCNSLARPRLASVNSHYQYLLKPVYDDGISAPRRINLPDARKLSLELFPYIPTDSIWSNLMPYYAQFVIHDITKLALSAGRYGSPIYCPCDTQDPECLVYKIKSINDTNYGYQACYAFPRAMPAAPSDCLVPHREQLNQMSSFLDLNAVYGTKLSQSNELRTMIGGRMRTKTFSNKTCLDYPPFPDKSSCPIRSRVCFETGDKRAENNLYLSAIGMLFLNEHNRVADALRWFNPYCSDEVLFQNARKITIAQYQHMTYKELVPILIGVKRAMLHSLIPFDFGYSFGYDEQINPSAFAECAGAAFRFAHIMVKEQNSLADDRYSLTQRFSIARTVFNSHYFFPSDGRNAIKALLNGALADTSYSWSPPQINPYSQSYMFENIFGQSYAPDDVKRYSLPLFDIARGRDLAFQSYNDYRERCGLPRAKTFDDFTNIKPYLRQKLAALYGDVDLVELYPGGICEDSVEGGIVGETFACLMAEQFKVIKNGDRFWYEHAFEQNIVHFSPTEIVEIRKASLNRLLCDHVGIDFIQKFPFLKQMDENPFVSCDQLPEIDFSKFDLGCQAPNEPPY